MTTVINAKELATTEVLVGKTAHEQLLLYPFAGWSNFEEICRQTLRVNNDEFLLLINHQSQLLVADKDQQPMYTLGTICQNTDLILDCPYSLLTDEFVDIRLMSKSVLSYLCSDVITNIEKDFIVTPINTGMDNVILRKSPPPMSREMEKVGVFSVLIDEQVSEFDMLHAKIRAWLPEGYQPLGSNFLMARTNTHCILIDPSADKLMFIGEYKPEFLERSELLVKEKPVVEEPEVETTEDLLQALTDLIGVCKAKGITMEEVVRTTVRCYD